MNKKYIVALFLILLNIVTIFLFIKPSDDVSFSPLKSESFQPIEFERLMPEKRTLKRRLYLTGVLDSQFKTAIKSKASGKLIEINVVEGDYVKKGQYLGRIHNESYKEDILTVENELKVAREELKKKSQELELQKKLFQLDTISREVFIGFLKQVDEQKKVVNRLKIKLAKAQEKLFNLKLFAPFDGKIVKVYCSIETEISKEDDVFYIADVNRLKVQVECKPDQAKNLSVGKIVQFSSRENDIKSLDFQIYSIAQQIKDDEFKAAFTVVCHATQPDESILLGIKLTGACILEKKENVLSLPQQILWREGSRFFVFVERFGKYFKQYVELGIYDSSYVEITKGLSFQDSILRIQSFSDYEQVLNLIKTSHKDSHESLQK